MIFIWMYKMNKFKKKKPQKTTKKNPKTPIFTSSAIRLGKQVDTPITLCKETANKLHPFSL